MAQSGTGVRMQRVSDSSDRRNNIGKYKERERVREAEGEREEGKRCTHGV